MLFTRQLSLRQNSCLARKESGFKFQTRGWCENCQVCSDPRTSAKGGTR